MFVEIISRRDDQLKHYYTVRKQNMSDVGIFCNVKHVFPFIPFERKLPNPHKPKHANTDTIYQYFLFIICYNLKSWESQTVTLLKLVKEKKCFWELKTSETDQIL